MAKKLRVRIIEIHTRGRRGFSKGFTIDGAIGLKQAVRMARDLFKNTGNPALNKAHRGVLLLSALPVAYQYNRSTRPGGEVTDRTHFWVSVPDPEAFLEFIKQDDQAPEEFWGLALLKTVAFTGGKVSEELEELEFIIDRPYEPAMLPLLDQWLLRIKEGVR